MSTGQDQLSSALEAVVARFAGMVRRVGYRHRLSDADVDEVMQEVRIRLWRAYRDSDKGGEQFAQVLTSYVFRTATSAAVDILRRRRAHGAERTVPLDESVAGSGVPGPAEVVEAAGLAEQVAQAIDTIAASRRPVVRMYLAGYPREEIASVMGWSEAKTRNLLYRGLADLRERLTEMGITWNTTA